MTRQNPFRLQSPKPPRLSENDVERQCCDWLGWRGYWVSRNHSGTFRSADAKRWVKGHKKGTPDYTALHYLYPGFLLEVKRPGEKASEVQEQRHFELNVGFRLAIVTVDSLEALKAWLDKHEKRSEEQWRERL